MAFDHLRISQLRRAKGLTQAQLAEMVGVKACVISFWETGRRVPTLSSLVRLCKALDVDSDFLLGLR